MKQTFSWMLEWWCANVSQRLYLILCFGILGDDFQKSLFLFGSSRFFSLCVIFFSDILVSFLLVLCFRLNSRIYWILGRFVGDYASWIIWINRVKTQTQHSHFKRMDKQYESVVKLEVWAHYLTANIYHAIVYVSLFE